MEGIIWLFLALLVALVALAVVLAGLRRRTPKIKPDHCPSCRTPMSLRRVVFSVWRGRSYIPVFAQRRRVRGVTPTRLPDFERSRSSIRCHFLWQNARDAAGKVAKSHTLLGEWECPHCGNRISSGKRVPGTAA
jgi:ribosomal protein L37AE/L43A